MKGKALQALAVVPRLFPEILTGRKTSTIRWHEPAIEPGPMLYRCNGTSERTALVRVTRVTRMPLREVAAFLGKTAEWPDSVMLEGMREHYPRIALDDVVDVIEHDPFQG